MNATTDLATLSQSDGDLVQHDTRTASLVLDAANMQNLMNMAEYMAIGRVTVPKHLAGNKGDCLAVCMQATQWGMNPFAVAQKTHLVNGTLGYEAQLVTAAINTSRAITGRLNYEWFGPWERIVGKFKKVTSSTKKDDDGKPKEYIVPDWGLNDEAGLGVRVWATLRGEAEPRTLEILMTQVRTRNSTLWAEDPKQQIAYLASKRWSRLHAPEVILGVYTPDELMTAPGPKDMGAAEVVEPANGASADLLDAARSHADRGAETFKEWWKSIDRTSRDALKPEIDDLKARTEKADAARTVEEEPKAEEPAADPWVADMERAEGEGQ